MLQVLWACVWLLHVGCELRPAMGLGVSGHQRWLEAGVQAVGAAMMIMRFVFVSPLPSPRHGSSSARTAGTAGREALSPPGLPKGPVQSSG